MFLELRDLRKNYSAPALDGVSFHVDSGEIFGLLGPNGAGKTTLLSIVAGLIDASSGDVLLQGLRFDVHARSLRKLIGIAPQEIALYGELSARENLRFFGSLYGLKGAGLEARVGEVLKTIALEDRADQRVQTFSGGMQRRLNLGAALVHEPKLLLLDEPTTGVDPQSRSHIFEEVRRLNRDGLTIIYTSHYMEEVQALCPRIGIIDHGRLIACDNLAAMVARQPGLIRLHGQISAKVKNRLRKLEGVAIVERDGRTVELECRQPRHVLAKVTSILEEERIELERLEMEEANLERVFLHLTGRGLRD